MGQVTTSAYDKLNRLIQTTEPDPDGTGPLTAPITKIAYDALGHRMSLTDPDNNTTTWTYDGLTRETSETNTLGKSENYDRRK